MLAGYVAAAIVLALSSLSVAKGQDDWELQSGRINDGRLFLGFSRAGNHFAELNLYCADGSGSVEVVGSMGEMERQAFADLIRHDAGLKIELDDEVSTVAASYSKSDGWKYHFRVAANGAALNKFKDTGRFKFKIANILVERGAKDELGRVSVFQSYCLKSTK
jgi:hypothetical protein